MKLNAKTTASIAVTMLTGAITWAGWVTKTLNDVSTVVAEIRGNLRGAHGETVSGRNLAESKEGKTAMNKSLKVHYMNKYPGGLVQMTDGALDVYDSSGNHCVALRKDGNGDCVDVSEEMGCCHKHDLSPIPKESRFMKLYKDGKIGRAEEFEQRKPVAHRLAGRFGKVPAIAELPALEAEEAAKAARAFKPAPVAAAAPAPTEPSEQI